MSRPRSSAPEANAKALAKQRRRKLARAKGIDLRTGQCTATARSGKRCSQSRAIVELNGKSYKANWCFAHIPEKYRERWGLQKFGGPRTDSGYKRIPKITEILREQVEQEAAEVLAPLFKALLARKPVVVGNGRFARVEMFNDHRTQLAAFQELMDRVYGKSRQITEISGRDGAPIEIEVPTDEEREAEVAKILAESGALHDPKAVAASMVRASQNPANQN